MALTRRELLILGGLIPVALKAENPLVGGTMLRRAAIQSPNFVKGSAGWAINQDGSAEFNNVVIRNGQIVSGTALFYSTAPPAFGKLVVSIAGVSGTDSFGNAYVAGVAAYDQATLIACQLTGDNLQFLSAPGAGGPWSVKATVAGDAGGDLILNSAGAGVVKSTSGLVVSGGTADQVTLTGAVAGGNVLDVTNTTAGGAAPISRVTAAAAGDIFFGGRVSGDTSARSILDSTATGGRLRLGPGNAGPDISVQRLGANSLGVLTSDLAVDTVGRGLQVKEGTNAKQGTAVLAAGTVVVSNTSVTANSRIFLTCQVPGGTPGFLRISARTAGTSFTILSSSSTDTSTVAYEIFEPAP